MSGVTANSIECWYRNIRDSVDGQGVFALDGRISWHHFYWSGTGFSTLLVGNVTS